MHKFVGIILVTVENKIILQRRDDKPTIDNPGKLSVFGGSTEDTEDLITAAKRELKEETGINPDEKDLIFIHSDKTYRQLTQESQDRYFYYLVLNEAEEASFKIYEGAGWEKLGQENKSKVVDSQLKPIDKCLSMLGSR